MECRNVLTSCVYNVSYFQLPLSMMVALMDAAIPTVEGTFKGNKTALFSIV